MIYEPQYDCDHAEITRSRGLNIRTDAAEDRTKGPFADVFTCDDPVNPQYSDYSERLKTYGRWPGYVNDPTPQKLSAAGLFYLGERDRCKCYYCNGGLQNWDFGDDPMEEHAKYFPQCEFVLQHKGPDYVAELNARHPNIRRPVIANGASQQQQQTSNLIQTAQNTSMTQQAQVRSVPQRDRPNSTNITDHSISINANSPSLVRSNMTAEQRQAQEYEIQLIHQAATFGFDKSAIERITATKFQQTGSRFTTLSDLIDELTGIKSNDHENINGSAQKKPENRYEYQRIPQTAANNTQQQNLESQLQSAKDESICVICRRLERSCVLLQCGHLCSCYECGKNLKICPICNGKVIETIQIYRI